MLRFAKWSVNDLKQAKTCKFQVYLDTSQTLESKHEVSPFFHAEVTRSLQSKTGFKGGEIFRKYLWYLLRERKFDQEAVNDIVYLKSVLNLNDDQVGEDPLVTCCPQKC